MFKGVFETLFRFFAAEFNHPRNRFQKFLFGFDFRKLCLVFFAESNHKFISAFEKAFRNGRADFRHSVDFFCISCGFIPEKHDIFRNRKARITHYGFVEFFRKLPVNLLDAVAGRIFANLKSFGIIVPLFIRSIAFAVFRNRKDSIEDYYRRKSFRKNGGFSFRGRKILRFKRKNSENIRKKNPLDLCGYVSAKFRRKAEFPFGFAFWQSGKRDINSVFFTGEVVFYRNFANRLKNRKSGFVFQNDFSNEIFPFFRSGRQNRLCGNFVFYRKGSSKARRRKKKKKDCTKKRKGGILQDKNQKQKNFQRGKNHRRLYNFFSHFILNSVISGFLTFFVISERISSAESSWSLAFASSRILCAQTSGKTARTSSGMT